MMAAPPPVIPDSVFLSPLAAPTAAPLLSAAHYPASPLLLNTTIARTIVYTYDNLSRLTEAGYSTGESFAYSYDDRGNRIQQIINGQTTGYTYDDANRLTAVNGQTYSWDDNGNLLSDGARTYAYGTSNRLTSVISGAVTTQFEYNGDGDRIAQVIGGSRTDYRLDPVGLSEVLVETTGGQSNYYLSGLAQYSSSGAEYFAHDRLGSIRHLVAPDGGLNLTQSFDPFGNLLAQEGTSRSIFGYAGEQTDPTGLIFLRARYYDPAVGRFLSADTIIPDPLRSVGWNRYAYVENNPIRYTDPSGYCGGPYFDAGIGSGSAIDGAMDDLCTGAGGGGGRGTPRSGGGFPPNSTSTTTGAVPRGMNNPTIRQSVNTGNKVHYDQANGGTGVGGPTQMQNQYPQTRFIFAPRGQAGPDVRVAPGQSNVHPSTYPGSTWPKGFNYADFKPNTPSGARTFYKDLNSCKLPTDTIPVPYDPKTGTLLTDYFFGP
jgi:RHS repeat-associated protein